MAGVCPAAAGRDAQRDRRRVGKRCEPQSDEKRQGEGSGPRHIIEEGFDEKRLVEALSGRIDVLEEYPDEGRFLVLGRFHFTSATTSALHILCDLSDERVLDIVTAYIPQRPWWVTPTQRGRKK